jgi:2'-5' RNA ligase
MNSLRVFFALLLPQSVQPLLATGLASLKNAFPEHSLKWIQPENLHITLQFLGNIPQEQVPELIQKIQVVLQSTPALQLQLGSLEWFPTLDHPKILSLSVEPQELLRNLATTLRQTLLALNLNPETRPFRGHITLGRIARQPVPYERLDQNAMPYIPEMLIDTIYLIESRRNSCNSSYHSLAEFKLI